MDRLGVMEVFVLAVETGSFSAVARRLGLGQPTVSRLIAQLETHLGSRLLLRSTRGLAPTEAGEAYYLRAREILAQVNEADAMVQQCRAGLSGRLRVSAPVTFARQNIIPHLAGFLAAHPGLDLEILMNDGNVDLIAAGIDVALRLGKQADSSLVARRLSRCEMRVLATPAYLAAKGSPASPQALQQHDLVLYSPRPGMRQQWRFRRDSQELVVSGRGRLTVSAAEGMRAAVLAGLGLGIASEWMFAQELARGEVVVVLPQWQLPEQELWTLLPAGRQPGAKASAFLAFVAGLPGLGHAPAE
ncbi:LysR family transcriptional regulator [Aeromonas caviae]